jgi:hypothetical protein
LTGLIVITGLEGLEPTERWSRLIAPLATQLEDSGLGELVDLSSLRQEVEERRSIDATEIAIRLRNFDYGRPLVDQVVAAAGLTSTHVRWPERWKSFPCDDYFASTYCRTGYFDETGQYWYVVPFDRIFEDEEAGFLEVGGAGFDGIRFGYRRGQPGIWAYPVAGEFVQVGETVDSFLQGYLSGAIRVG